MKAFAHSKASTSADAAANSVMTALATGRPAAALVVSLRAAELEPTQPRHLVNAAVVLIGYGDLKDANGLLAAAGKLRGSGAALGVTEGAELSAAKAELDVATGHFSLAEQVYRAVVAQNPSLLAAQEGLAQALSCEKKTGPAIARWSRAQRDQFDYVAADDPGGDGTPPAIDAGFVSEASGKDIAGFGSYYRPVDQDDATAHAAAYKQDYDAASARFLAIDQAITAENPTDRRDRNYLGFAGLVVNDDKQMKALLAQDGQIDAELVALTSPGDAYHGCYFSQEHQALWNLVDRRLANHAAQAHRAHILYTAMAADIEDPVTNHILNQTADEVVGVAYSTVIGLASQIAGLEKMENGSDACKANSGMTDMGTGTETPEDASPATDACSAAKVERIKIKLGAAVSAELSCEGGKIEVLPVKYGIDQAYIGAFGEAGVKWKSGDITGVAGVKVSVSTPDIAGLPEVGANGKAGFYVTAGRTKPGQIAPYGETRSGWEVKDWGIRLQSTAEIPGSKVGAVSTITKFDSKVDISLVGVFN